MQRKEKRKDTGSLGYEPTAHLNSLFLPTLLPFHEINHFYFFFPTPFAGIKHSMMKDSAEI